MATTDEGRGLSWSRRFGKNLLFIEPENVVFPMRCLFTNDPVDECTTMTLYELEAEHGAALSNISQRTMEYDLPISQQWLARRTRTKERIGKLLVRVGCGGFALALLGGAMAVLPGPKIVPEMVLAIFVAVTACVGIFGLIIGLAWPHLKDNVSDPRTIGASFVDETGGIVIPDVHADFVAHLPQVK